MGIEIDIDRDVCMGSGNCVYAAPGVFELDDDSIARVVDPAASPEDDDRHGGAPVPDPRHHRAT